MHQHERYEILGLIGNGDFAAVYRARDRELGRDVAIKQIHGQYMNDPRRLERFWREAQLLAALQHPNILTIYDVVRPRGWLVLELMQGTLLDASRGQPIDLGLLRSAMCGALSALSLLHSNRVIHGDIKPSNLLLDKQGRVKIGDFGLARRVASDQGSYLKGATRYMAPELVAPQFGAVGPGSDLYSLGFTAYELLCGPQQFENLFPGLEAFGRDRQIAWMMWHAAPDRRLPPVASVLDGVPADLARVIDRLTIKNPAQRYQSAEQALADLSVQPAAALPPSENAEEATLARKRKFQRRLVAGMALAASLLVSTLVAVMPTGKKPPPAAPEAVAIRGVVRTLLPERQTVIVEQGGDLGPKEIMVRSDDRVFLNSKASLLRELKEADQVTIQTLRNELGKPILEIQASRPQEDQGTIAVIKPDDGELTIKLAGSGQELNLAVAEQTRIELNAASAMDGQPLALADLKEGDRVTIVHFLEADRETALKISALRVVAGEGVVRAINLKKGEVSIAAGPEDAAAVAVWKLAERPQVTLNGRSVLNNRELTPADLLPGDLVTFQRDVKVVSIAAQRLFIDSGKISAIRYDVRSFTAAAAAGGERTYVLSPQCAVTLGGAEARFDDLRRGDTFDVTFDEPDAASPAVKSITALRPADPSKWAVMVVGATFDDSTVPGFAAATAGAASLQQVLTSKYAVPAEQVIVVADASRVRLEQALADAMNKAAAAGQLLVVIAGRTLVEGKSPPLFAPKDFARARSAATGIPLTTLLTEVEKCSSGQKLVFLDLAPIAAGEQSAGGPPSTATQLDSIRGTRSRPLLRTTTVFATDRAAAVDASATAGLISELAAGVAGPADPNRDNLCTVGELHDYFKSAGGTPIRLILPETTPPRLSDDAKEAIRRLAAAVAQLKVDRTDAQLMVSAADRLAPKQPEPRLLGGILLLKAKEHAEALSHLEAVVAQNPKTPLAWEVSAWARFEKLNYAGGVSDLTQLVRNLPSGTLPDAEKRALSWVGRLREFAAAGAAPERRPPPAAIDALDAAVVARGADVQKLYQQGRDAARVVVANFDRQVAAADADGQLKLRFDRVKLSHYASFSLEAAAQQVVASLDAE
jgi:eukaryotic-like serine/threonine-protein kinase